MLGIGNKLSQLSLSRGRWALPVCLSATCDYYVYKDPNYKTIPKMPKRKKHKDPKFRRDRGLKMCINPAVKILRKEQDEVTPVDTKTKLKERGIQPVRPWNERPVWISTSAGVFDPYVPPEGDGRISITTAAGAKQKVEQVQMKGRSLMNLRKIRQYDDDFEPGEFVDEAREIYVNMHHALVKFDEDRLHELLTEHAYAAATDQVKKNRLRWSFHGSLEPPRVVHIRCTEILSRDNVFAQVTVRFHTRQALAVYDRFGRLQYGSEVVVRDVLEYVVFEKQISNIYGTWRIHEKIVPEWMPPKPPGFRTYRVDDEEEDTAAVKTSTSHTEEAKVVTT